MHQSPKWDPLHGFDQRPGGAGGRLRGEAGEGGAAQRGPRLPEVHGGWRPSDAQGLGREGFSEGPDV